MPLPGDFSITPYKSLAKTIGLPVIPTFSLPAITTSLPKAVSKISPKVPQIKLLPGTIADNTASETASGFAAAMDSADASALAALTSVNPVTGV